MKSRSLRAVTTRLNELRTLKESDKISGLSCYPYANRLIRLHDGETLGNNGTSDETEAPHDGGPAAGVIRPATPTSELVSSASSKGLYVQSDPTFDFTDQELSMGEFGDAFDGRTYQTNFEMIHNSAIAAALSYDTEKEAARAKVPADTMKKVKAFAKQRYLVAHTLRKSSILEEVLKDLTEERREKLGALGKDGGHATQRQKLALPPRVQPPSGVQIQTLRRAISSTGSVTGSSSATNQTLSVPPRAPAAQVQRVPRHTTPIPRAVEKSTRDQHQGTATSTAPTPYQKAMLQIQKERNELYKQRTDTIQELVDYLKRPRYEEDRGCSDGYDDDDMRFAQTVIELDDEEVDFTGEEWD